MSTTDRDRWNAKYSKVRSSVNCSGDEWLLEACETIAQSTSASTTAGRAIDLACGRGQNAIWLAQHGWTVDGVDISPEGLNMAHKSAAQSRCSVCWIEADLDDWLPPPAAYDLAIVFRFLDRVTIPRIVTTGVRPGGWLIYETFSAGQLQRPENHIGNPAFTLTPGELPVLFPGFEVINYHEACLANRTVQRLLAQRLS